MIIRVVALPLVVGAVPARAENAVKVESFHEVLSWDPHAAWHLQSTVQTWAMRDRLVLPPDPRLSWDFRCARLSDAPAH